MGNKNSAAMFYEDTYNPDYYKNDDKYVNSFDIEEMYDLIMKPNHRLLLIQYYARKYYNDQSIPADIIKLISILFLRLNDYENMHRIVPWENQASKLKRLFVCKKILGEGASAKVFLAQKKFGDDKEQLYALKELHRKHSINRHLFLHEALILQYLDHPNIMTLYGLYLDESSYFIASSYYSGGELFDLIIKKKKFKEKEIVKYIIQILAALEYIHSKHVAFVSLKPSNIVLDKKGKDATLKLVDFGESAYIENYDKICHLPRRSAVIFSPPEYKNRSGAQGRYMVFGHHCVCNDCWKIAIWGMEAY